MLKLKQLLSLSLIPALLFFSSPLFAEDNLTITTYYPSPYGSYNETRANKMVIGDVTNATASPSEGVVTFKPKSTPISYSEGSLYYDSSEHTFKYRDNTAWQSMGGSSYSFTYYCYLYPSHGSPLCVDAGGTQRFCPAGFTQRLALGAWGRCCSFTACDCDHHGDWLLVPGATCGSGASSYVSGNAYVCSSN